ncbi:hypothetical protein EVAR_5510_1 [Eumeta japonica]|uniref:Uncharacterized protein n=1 Tax=Eumeta variegata TaxID=151549 RepID=A0A4C1T8U2_EUMVA|nr:hypothetical protein EVAR_5510_1 [Eumeta japonica]
MSHRREPDAASLSHSTMIGLPRAQPRELVHSLQMYCKLLTYSQCLALDFDLDRVDDFGQGPVIDPDLDPALKKQLQQRVVSSKVTKTDD